MAGKHVGGFTPNDGIGLAIVGFEWNPKTSRAYSEGRHNLPEPDPDNPDSDVSVAFANGKANATDLDFQFETSFVS